ncbi:xanthine dehydrogenase family protein subunit M [Sphaerisporangium album]|uniref:Xanthine dehydrogenase family protein subunit M n=1 Tax=Sphaerisporangium album TaxID=509200 RepID=A0A367F268_9ACTN|nr:xanthine dehydrogenase family protein subunit M [Sphaerisporangium album]RCG24474.1 xanthine dehydrogenase family protein subunit M [Sphaerisporangium album]
MIPASFDYVRASSVDEAVEVLADAGEEAKVLSGGQSLLPLLRLRLAYPSVLVDVGRLPELRGVRDEGGHVHIGATTTHDEIIRSPVVRAGCPLVALATATVADPAVRHRGTFGGSMAHADPAGDLPAVAVALDMEFVLRSTTGERVVTATDFFTDYLETALEPGEILTAVRVPKLGEGWGYHYEKFHRTAQAWAIVGVAAAVRVTVSESGARHVAEARVGLTNMGPTPLRATAVESAAVDAELPPVPHATANGSPSTARLPSANGSGPHDTLREAASLADGDTSPTADLHATPDYRRHLARVLTHRALTHAAATV